MTNYREIAQHIDEVVVKAPEPIPDGKFGPVYDRLVKAFQENIPEENDG